MVILWLASTVTVIGSYYSFIVIRYLHSAVRRGERVFFLHFVCMFLTLLFFLVCRSPIFFLYFKFYLVARTLFGRLSCFFFLSFVTFSTPILFGCWLQNKIDEDVTPDNTEPSIPMKFMSLLTIFIRILLFAFLPLPRSFIVIICLYKWVNVMR